jgi:hypothetical protein
VKRVDGWTDAWRPRCAFILCRLTLHEDSIKLHEFWNYNLTIVVLVLE